MLFVAENTELIAESLGLHESAGITFKRTAEFHRELVEAIDNTINQGQVRPAYSLLRTLLEMCTSFSWLAQNFDSRIEKYSTGRLPSIQKMMSSANLNWSNEYKNTYSSLSNFVHGSFVLSDFKKEAVIHEVDEEISYTFASDVYVCRSKEKSRICHIYDRNQEELIREHKSFLTIKVFDIVITFLMRASGSYSDSSRWWPGIEIMEEFNSAITLIERDHCFLWPTEKKRLAINKVEGRYA